MHIRQEPLLFFTKTGFASHSGCKISLIIPASSSFETSCFAASCLSVDIFRMAYFLGLIFGSTLSLCSMMLLSMPLISLGDHAKTSSFCMRRAKRVCSSSCCKSALNWIVFDRSVSWRGDLFGVAFGLRFCGPFVECCLRIIFGI